MNKRNLFFCLLLLILSIQSHAQNAHIDSIKKELSDTKDDSSKVNLLLALSREFFSISPEEAISYATEAKDLAIKKKLHKELAYAYKTIGIVNYNQADYVESLATMIKHLPYLIL